MPRYIDADLEVAKYVTVWDCDCSEFGKQTVMAVDDLYYLPTADVAPRAEVAREIFEEIQKMLDRCWLMDDYGMTDMMIDVAELKKEYTDVEPEPPKGE